MVSENRWLSKAVGEIISKRRKDLKLTQASLAKSLRVQRTSISNIEAGRQVLLLDVFYDLCKLLGLSAVDVLSQAAERDPDNSAQLEEIANVVEIVNNRD